MQKAVERLRADLEALVTQASQQDEADEAALGSRRGDALPAELARREERLARSEAARRRLEAQAQADAEAERQRRAAADAERQRTGKKRRGKAPTPVEESPDDTAQSNVTDPELHIMRTNNKGWESCGNAQASVDGACQSILAGDVTDASNDKQQAEPVAQATLATLTQAGLERPKDASGAAQASPATVENGYDSEAALAALPGWWRAVAGSWRLAWPRQPDRSQCQFLRLPHRHLLTIGLMVKGAQVQNAVGEQVPQFPREGMAVFMCLAPRPLHGDGNVAQVDGRLVLAMYASIVGGDRIILHE